MGDIFREIDEELRHDRFDKLWRKYGRYLIGAAVAVVLAVAAVKGWQQYRTSERLADGARFAAAKANLRDGKTADAEALMAALARDSGTSYGTLARFHEAALKADAGDAATAVRIYDALAADSGIGDPLRELAVILSALHALDAPAADVAVLPGRLQPLIRAGGPWRHSALEILALLAQEAGDTDKAREHYRRIADDPEAPQNIRGRAAQMLAILGT